MSGNREFKEMLDIEARRSSLEQLVVDIAIVRRPAKSKSQPTCQNLADSEESKEDNMKSDEQRVPDYALLAKALKSMKRVGYIPDTSLLDNLARDFPDWEADFQAMKHAKLAIDLLISEIVVRSISHDRFLDRLNSVCQEIESLPELMKGLLQGFGSLAASIEVGIGWASTIENQSGLAYTKPR